MTEKLVSVNLRNFENFAWFTPYPYVYLYRRVFVPLNKINEKPCLEVNSKSTRENSSDLDSSVILE